MSILASAAVGTATPSALRAEGSILMGVEAATEGVDMAAGIELVVAEEGGLYRRRGEIADGCGCWGKKLEREQ